MSVVVAGLVAAAVLVVLAPPPRRLRPVPGASSGDRGLRAGRARWGRYGSDGHGSDGRRSGRRGSGRRGSGRRGSHGRGTGTADDLAGILHAVAGQLRVGVPPAVAWGRALDAPGDGTVEESRLAAVLSERTGGRTGPDAALATRVRAVVAGTRVAAETGAPLADVLEDLAAAVAADAEQAGELAAALAGPRATARVLALLPVLGLLVGAAMGARPWEVLTDGGPGTLLGVAGASLVACGRWWVAALMRRAAGL